MRLGRTIITFVRDGRSYAVATKAGERLCRSKQWHAAEVNCIGSLGLILIQSWSLPAGRASSYVSLRSKVHRAWMHTRNDIFFGLRTGHSPDIPTGASPISVTRVSAVWVRLGAFVCRERIDAIPRAHCRGDQLTNVRAHAPFSPFGLPIQINSVCLVEAPDVALRKRRPRTPGRQHAALECIMMQQRAIDKSIAQWYTRYNR